MLFNSLHFALFFPAILLLYWIFPARFRKGLLVAASYYFYGAWDARFLMLLLFVTVVDFLSGRAMYAASSEKARRAFLIVSIASNCTALGFFKYFNFFIDTLNWIPGIHIADAITILLPVGISFYTFQNMTYTIDIYRGTLKPASLADYFVFSSFFPQLVAGPIVRASQFLPQLSSERILSMHDMGEGVVLFFRGFCKKVLFADLLARAIDPVFADPAAFSALHCLFAVYGFAFQIFYDFSGYTDMARGAARMLGYDLPINFNHPYLSTSFRDFWKRWHISLSTWIRDYLYISLGGSRKGRVRTYVNLLLTMTLAGLWHGANATFILWGLFHGAMLSIERAVVPFVKGNDFFSAPAVMIARRLVVFHLVCAGWILFRCDSVAGAVRMVLCLFSGSWLPSAGPVAALGSAIGVFALWNIVSGAAEKYNLAGVWFGRIRVVMYGAAAAAAFIYSTTSQPFIYFQF